MAVSPEQSRANREKALEELKRLEAILEGSVEEYTAQRAVDSCRRILYLLNTYGRKVDSISHDASGIMGENWRTYLEEMRERRERADRDDLSSG